jgi:hypothetical protein
MKYAVLNQKKDGWVADLYTIDAREYFLEGKVATV